MKGEVVTQVAETARAALPAITVSGLTIFGVPLPDIVHIATLVYLAVAGGYILYKWKKGI